MLAEFTAWLKSLVISVFKALWGLVTDLLINFFDLVVTGFATVIAAIPVPAWMSGGLQALWVQLDNGALYVLSACGVPEALAIIGAGYLFRFGRKIATLFQW